MQKERTVSRLKPPIVAVLVGSITCIVLLGALGVFLFDLSIPGIGRTDAITQDEVDTEIAYLKTHSPELFAGEYATLSAAELAQRMRQNIAERRLLVQEAQARGITDVDEQLALSFAAIRAGIGTDEEYELFLSEQNVTEQAIKDRLAENLIINELAKSLVSEQDIAAAQIQSHFEANQSFYPSDFGDAKQQVLADLLGKKRAEAIELLLAQLR
ncbi:MAG: SurA N-terminal domain-containing protein [Coriobacteriia bacterium]|nr:SurA N-terminal domain-containing protein [Coriobacteriia bacterium]